MLLKIDYKEEDIVFKGKGRIILNCRFYAQFATLLHLATTSGHTKQDFQKNDCLKDKQVFVGQKGGISIE